MVNKKEISRKKRHHRIRKHLAGTSQVPRLVVHRSLKNMSVQVIDDTVSKTMCSMSTRDKQIKAKLPYGGNVKAAGLFGEEFAKILKEKGISRVVFDRAGYLYHGRVKAFVECLRKGGLVF